MLNKYRMTDGLDKFWARLTTDQRFDVIGRWDADKLTLSEHMKQNEPDLWFRFLAWKVARS